MQNKLQRNILNNKKLSNNAPYHQEIKAIVYEGQFNLSTDLVFKWLFSSYAHINQNIFQHTPFKFYAAINLEWGQDLFIFGEYLEKHERILFR